MDSYTSNIMGCFDYYPFGMLMPGRNGGDYSFGFQGQLQDNEIKGKGNSVNYKYRMHDPRLGRFFAVDPLTSKYPHYTPYQFSGNKPIQFVELEGLEEGAPKFFYSIMSVPKGNENMHTIILDYKDVEFKAWGMVSVLGSNGEAIEPSYYAPSVEFAKSIGVSYIIIKNYRECHDCEVSSTFTINVNETLKMRELAKTAESLEHLGQMIEGMLIPPSRDDYEYDAVYAVAMLAFIVDEVVPGDISIPRRKKAIQEAKDFSKVPRISKGGQKIEINDLNPSSRLRKWEEMKAGGATTIGQRNPNGKNEWMEHPDGHPDMIGAGHPSHHANGHVHATNSKGEKKVIPYKH